ncbi:MAG: Rpn family recombination-promoting nuclease/putative transposase [Planctomycetaceae bacterium]
MPNSRVEQIIRQFAENGIKLLLEHPANVRDLLRIAGTDLVDLIDLDRLTLIQTTFVERDYRHVESDVVLIAPIKAAGRRHRRVMVYILIEHQSAPDRLMPLRMLDYMVQLFKFQQRQWTKEHHSFARIQFDPILPIVLYTGTPERAAGMHRAI